MFKKYISNYWLWLYWIVPLQWTYKGIAVNELKSPSYDLTVCNVDGICDRFGDTILRSYSLPLHEYWVGICILVPFLQAIIFMIISIFIFENHQPQMKPLPQSTSSSRKSSLSEEEMGHQTKSSQTIGFTPVTLSFNQLCYSVESDGTDKPLLKNVFGHFIPGTLTAVMGASGAGKYMISKIGINLSKKMFTFY